MKTYRDDLPWGALSNPFRPGAPGVPAEPNPSPVAFARTSLAFQPDPIQAAILDSPAKRGILLCTRQWGKSTILAAKAVHRAYTTPGALILIASPGDRQSRLLLDKAAAFLTQLDMPRRSAGGPDPTLVLPNRSRIVALPPNPPPSAASPPSI